MPIVPMSSNTLADEPSGRRGDSRISLSQNYSLRKSESWSPCWNWINGSVGPPRERESLTPVTYSEVFAAGDCRLFLGWKSELLGFGSRVGPELIAALELKSQVGSSFGDQ